MVLAWLLAWPLVPGRALAQPLDVRQLALQRTTEALFLNARLELTLAPAVQDALLKGVPLYFVWEARVWRNRWYWTDRRVADARRVLRLAYQPLTRLWRVSISTDVGGSAGAGLPYALHQNHDSLEEALGAVARVARWRLANATDLDPGASHYVDFAFRLDLSLLPRPFQIGLGNQSEWTLAVERELRVPDLATPESAAEARATGDPRAVEAAADSTESADSPGR
ncbi:MAG: DUF4390 domain-containing protein [Hydrogenophaga sp.]|nr:DUF4390 domain-containing protein [Hydrogenophaga sp.]